VSRRARALGVILITAAAAAAAGATATAFASGGAVRVRGAGTVGVQGAPGERYVLRTTYLVPANWRRVGRTRGRSLARRFGPIGSCRIRVTIRGSAVADAPEASATRAARLLPGGAALLDDGTRGNAAYRVVRAANRDVDALLVKPAPTVGSQPAPRIVWVELRARAVIDRRTECHAGGPRTVGTLLGDTFAAARLGGFEPSTPP
jgi:hypothetical protein